MIRNPNPIQRRLLVRALAVALTLPGCVGEEVILEITQPQQESSDDTETHPGDGDTDGCGDWVWEDSVYIDYAPELRALEGVTRIRGRLQIQSPEGDVRKYVDALSSLRCVDGSVIVNDVDELLDLDDLSALHTVGGDLLIERNDRLQDVSGIRNIRNLGGTGLYITDNDSLPTCNARNLYKELNAHGWEGTPCIEYNADDECESLSRGCSDQYRW